MEFFNQTLFGMLYPSFTIVMMFFIGCIFIVVKLMHKLLDIKINRELKLAKLMYEESEIALNFEEWEKEKKRFQNNVELAKHRRSIKLDKDYNKLSKSLLAAKLLIQEFSRKEINLRESKARMLFIHNVLKGNEKKVAEFKNRLSHLLGEDGCDDEKQLTDENFEINDSVMAMVRAQQGRYVYKETEERMMKIVSDLENSEVNNSIFGKDLVVNGNVQSTSSILVQGQIIGNISSQGIVELRDSGDVQGAIEARELHVYEGKVEGNIKVENIVYVGDKTIVKGDIIADHLVIDGVVEGNISVQSEIKCSNHAKILGDVSASLIDIEKGAKILGSINILGY